VSATNWILPVSSVLPAAGIIEISRHAAAALSGEHTVMAHFDWDIGPKRRRWEHAGQGDGKGPQEEGTYWRSQFENLCARRGITEEEQHIIWEAMAYVCSQQMHEKRGIFYEALHPFFEGMGAVTRTDPSESG
jgi:hypothetical protein